MSNTGSDVDDIPQDSDFNTDTERLLDEENVFDEEQILEEEPLILRSEDFISGPFVSENSTVADEILTFDFSYGYDCKKYYNLVVADANTVIFISGNLLHFLNVQTKELRFRRSAFGGGLGHLTKNPNPLYPHIAIGENGEQPPIIVYEWPSLEIVCLLREGTARSFTHLNYSPNGELLVSQGGEPDFLITVWNWRKSSILLRTKSNVNDVYRAMFSPYVPGHLTSCGLSHIKFWKMAHTFTGLKLQGELGRFGKTEYSDILGIYPMPDEKVISGCHWGNFLVWEAGLIKLEVFRKLRKKCHEGPIVQFDFRDGELWTVSMDGRIKVWHYDTIEQADPPDDDRVVQTEPVYNFHTPGVMFMCVLKRSPDPSDTFYFAQDGNGGLWKIDLTTEYDVAPPEQLYKCHAGAVADIAPCPWGPYLASLGVDGRLQLYTYYERKLIFTHQFPAKGVRLMWLPLTIDPSGDVLILAFDDGNLRVCVLSINEVSNEATVTLLQITKPHHEPITYMSINTSGSVLVTSGADLTIFVFKLDKRAFEYVRLVPIGMIPTSDVVTYMTWHRNDDTTIIVGCMHGFIDEVTLPTEPQNYTTISYALDVSPLHLRFVTYKAQIRRDIKLREIAVRKAARRELKMVDLEKYKKENPGLDIDEEIFLADSESEEELEPLHIPEVPNKVMWIQHTIDDTLWLSMGGYDAGYIYEYYMLQKSEIPSRFTMVCDGDDTEISSFVYNHDGKYLILAMENGALRLVKVKKDFRDLSDYWQLSMHDNLNGFIPRMCFSYDERYFFSCGHDGNIFSYKFFPEDDKYVEPTARRMRLFKDLPAISDDVDESYRALSLEQAIVKAEVDRKNKLANDHKKEYHDKLFALRKKFQVLLKRNKNLLPTQVIPPEKLLLDARITTNLEEKLDDELALVKRKLAYQVEMSEVRMKKMMRHFIDPLDVFPITVAANRTMIRVTTLRQRKLDPAFYEMHELVDQKIIEAEIKGRPPERPPVVAEPPPVQEKQTQRIEFFLVGLSPSTIESKMGAKLNRLLHNYRMRKARKEKRQQQWEKFNLTQPVEGINHPDDELALKEAIQTIGDYKLKSALDYKVPKELRESTVKKYKQLLNMRSKQFEIRHRFNKKVHDLRDDKSNLKDHLVYLSGVLKSIHKEIPSSLQAVGPDIIETYQSDYPEKNLEIVVKCPPPRHAALEPKVQPKTVVTEPTGDLLEKEVLLVLIKQTEYRVKTMTPWEKEAKDLRLKRKEFEQNQIIDRMEAAIAEFDEKIEAAFNERLQVIVDAHFIDLHLLTLNQELIILKKFEAYEDQLSDNVRNTMEELLDLHDMATDLNNKVEARKREIETLEEKGKQIQQRFSAVAADNKFFDFLRRIFKKKYKPPKVRGPDDSESDSDSSSSSSSSDDEEDAGSIDSRDVGPIRLDESVCPKGCDQTLYDLTFELRNQRHGVELEIKEFNRVIDQIKKDLETTYKKTKNTEVNLQRCQEELEAFQREKQQMLNEVMCTVVLKLHQMQHLFSDTRLNNIRDTIIFSKAALAKLYKRVGQLQNETLQQKAKHKLNIIHLGRMKTDCKHMEKRIHELEEEVEETMRQKFGKVVKLEDVQEALLKRLVFSLKMSMLDIRSLYEQELIMWRDKYGEKQSELAKAIRDNTSKLELLGLMNRERADLIRQLQNQEEKRAHIEMIANFSDTNKEDIRKLTEIVKRQRCDLCCLRDEIKMLKTRGLQQRPARKPSQDAVEEEEELELMELDEDDDVIEVEFDFDVRPEFKISRRISTVSLMAKDIIMDMLNALNIVDVTSETEIEQICVDILEHDSIASIIEELLKFLKHDPLDEEQSIVETFAEQLYSIREPEVTKSDIIQSCTETLDEILNTAFIKLENKTAIAEMICEIVQQLPVDFVLQQESITSISKKILECESEIIKEELIEAVFSMAAHMQRAEIETVLQCILQEVFGSGIDYLYIIKD